MLAPCWLHVGSMLAHVGSMLAHVGPSGLQDGPTWLHVGPSWPQDAIMLAQVGLKMPKTAFNSQIGSFFYQKIAHSGTSWICKILKTTICFIGPFAICTFLFLLMLFGSLSWLKFAPSWLMLAYLSKLESKLNQVGTNLAQDASILSQVGLRKKVFLSEGKTS